MSKVFVDSAYFDLKWVLAPRVGNGSLEGDNLKLLFFFNLLEFAFASFFMICEMLGHLIPKMSRISFVVSIYLWIPFSFMDFIFVCELLVKTLRYFL